LKISPEKAQPEKYSPEKYAPEEERDIKRIKVVFNPIQRYTKEKPLMIRRDTIELKKNEEPKIANI
jgi:hypothetical protein